MSDTGERLIFIVGQYKSGSTWLANLLTLHPEVRGLRETQVFRYALDGRAPEATSEVLFHSVSWAEGGRSNLPRHRAARLVRPLRRGGQASLRWSERPTTLLDLGLRDQVRLRRELAGSVDGEDYCRRFFAFLDRALAPPRYLLEKSVTSIEWVSRIRDIFPRARLISIHRDGRDVVVSDRFHLLNQYGREQDFRDSVLRWRRAIEAEAEHAGRSGLLTLSYEDLLRRPHETAASLLARLDLPAAADVVQDMVRRSSFEFVTGRRLGSEDRSSFYRKGGWGDWKKRLDDAQKELFGELAGDWLVRLGYERHADWRRWDGGDAAGE